MWVSGAFLTEDYRGQGVGSEFMKQVIEMCRRQGVRILELEAVPISRHIAEKNGFQVVGKPNQYGGVPMRLNLHGEKMGKSADAGQAL